MSALEVLVERLQVVVAGRSLVTDGSLRAAPGSVVALVGPNGCGKTTLVRTLYRAQQPHVGTVRVGPDEVWSLSVRESARLTAMVAQVESDEFELTVRETVALGRVPHHGLLHPQNDEDDSIVSAAMATAGVEHLAPRLASTLSGGERQRVAVARALAQQTPVIVLDEPTNHLDVSSQLELLELLRSLAATVVVVLHDLNLAAAYADHVFVMASGRHVADGPPVEVLTPELLAEVYGVRAVCDRNPLTGRLALHVAPGATPHPPNRPPAPPETVAPPGRGPTKENP